MILRNIYTAQFICDPTPRVPQILSVTVAPSPAHVGDALFAYVSWVGFPRDDAVYTFQWYRFGEPIPGATEVGYVATTPDLGADALSVVVSVTNDLGMDYGTSQQVTIYPLDLPTEGLYDGDEPVYDGDEVVEDTV